jgi:lysozyme family protein
MKYLNTIISFIRMILKMSIPPPTVPPTVSVTKKEVPMDDQNTSTIDPDSFSAVALPLVLIFEGGYSNIPEDKGGSTNHGVTQKTYDSYRQLKNLDTGDVKDITDDEVSEIYYNYYWLASHCDKMPEKVAVVVFDTSVNSGGGRAARTLQQALGVNVDGSVGNITLSKLQESDPLAVANSFLGIREQFYNNLASNDPTQQKFLAGWLRRLGLVKDFVNEVKGLDGVKAAW